MPETNARIDITRFHKFDELTAILNGWVEQYPNLARLDSIGKSYEGRDIWVLTITNQETGADTDKPAMYIDGNIHAGEVTGCNVALYTAEMLLLGYGNDADITTLLDTRTFYIAPRVQPDGAELYLTTPITLRSSVRNWPEVDDHEGLVPDDINNDGLVVQMRVPDPKGEWRISEHDDRLMVKRRPDELTGTFYRIYTEGYLNDWVRGPVKIAPPKYGIDQNRNWPANWSVYQRGGGPFPLSEPETRAVAGFIDQHRNISIIQNYHTMGGVILRSPCAVGDAAIPPRDMEVYEVMGKIGQEITGYPPISVYDAFPELDERGRRNTSGGFIEWTYDHLGIFSFATELWDLQSRAGIEKPAKDPMRVVRELTEEDGLKLLKFNDEQLNGEGFVPWTAFEHPQLGPVEIGGWKTKEMRQNAPPQFLEDECVRNAAFSVRQAAMTPRLTIENVEVETLAENLHVVRAIVSNEGFLPTNGSAQAVRNNIARPVKVDLEGAEVVMGKASQQIGHLMGRSANRGMMMMFGMAKVENERMVEWLVRGSGSVTITASSDKAGTVRQEVALGS